MVKGGKIPCPVDASGCFTDEVSDFKGLYVKVMSKAAFCLLAPKLEKGQSMACLKFPSVEFFEMISFVLLGCW